MKLLFLCMCEARASAATSSSGRPMVSWSGGEERVKSEIRLNSVYTVQMIVVNHRMSYLVIGENHYLLPAWQLPFPQVQRAPNGRSMCSLKADKYTSTYIV